MWTPDQDRGTCTAPCLQPVCSVKRWQLCSPGVEGWSKQQHVPVSCCLPCSLLKWFHVRCSWSWIGAEETPSPPVTHSTREIVGDTAPKFPYSSGCLAAEAKLNHWADLSLLNFAQFDLIWLNVWRREEDWPKPQLGILFAPVFVFSSDWTLSEETSEEVFCRAEAVLHHHHHLRSAAAWKWNVNRADCFPFSTSLEGIHVADATTPQNSSRRPVCLSLRLLYTGEKVFHFLLPSILVILVWKQKLCPVLRRSPALH